VIRLIALDLDGTLFSEDLVVSPANRAAIAAAQARGIVVTLATGRMFRATLPHAQALGITAPLICYQGALIRDPVSGATLLHRPVPRETAFDVLAMLTAEGLYPNLYLDDNLYVAEMNPGTEFYARLNGGLPINPVGDITRFLASREDAPTKITVVLPRPGDTDPLVERLRARFGERIYATKSYPIFAEVINPACDKGAALAALAERLGIAREETMAVGDGLNDLPMLAWAGVGVAMGQASPAVRQGATHVTSPLAEDGLAAAIHRFALT
jgi:Cof subfamily protein (haloacid dehalogenase superfamily)